MSTGGTLCGAGMLLCGLSFLCPPLFLVGFGLHLSGMAVVASTLAVKDKIEDKIEMQEWWWT